MKLMTKAITDRFAQVGDQQDKALADHIIIAKFFNPTGAGTWFATEFNPENQLFFGFVSIFGDHNDEWGSFSLVELEELELPFGLGIERDMHYGEKKASEEPIIAKSIR